MWRPLLGKSETVMKTEVGKEIEFVQHRLSTIVYLAEKTAPVDDADWEGYARSMRNLIAREAHEALAALQVIAVGQSATKTDS